MEDCNIARASPASTDTSSDTTVWHDTILHTVTNLWGPAQLRGGDTTHQHTEHANFTEPIPMRCSHLNLQFFQHWIKSRVCDLSVEEECLWLVWCLDLSGLSVPALSARQIGEGSQERSPDRQLITSEYYLANLVFSRISSTIRNGSFHSPSSQFSAQQRRVKYQN